MTTPDRKLICLALVEASNGLKLRATERCPSERLPGFDFCAHHVGETVAAYRKLTGQGDDDDAAPCSDCGRSVRYIAEPWYAIDSGGLCVPCGKARGLGDEYLM